MWRHQELGFGAYSIALLNNVSYNVMEFAKSQVNKQGRLSDLTVVYIEVYGYHNY